MGTTLSHHENSFQSSTTAQIKVNWVQLYKKEEQLAQSIEKHFTSDGLDARNFLTISSPQQYFN